MLTVLGSMHCFSRLQNTTHANISMGVRTRCFPLKLTLHYIQYIHLHFHFNQIVFCVHVCVCGVHVCVCVCVCVYPRVCVMCMITHHTAFGCSQNYNTTAAEYTCSHKSILHTHTDVPQTDGHVTVLCM